MVAADPSSAGDTASRPGLLRRHWRLAAFVCCGIVPFAPSIWAMRSFLLADNALGFVPFMLPAAAFLFWFRSRRSDRPARRDVLLDCFFALPALALAVFLLFLTPARLSWYFWLYRVDLLAMALVVLAAGCVFLGYQQVLRGWQAFALLFLVWPYPVVRLQDFVAGPMTRATVLVGRGATAFLQLPYHISGGTFTSYRLPPDQAFSITLSSLCSGSALTMGFLLVGIFLCCVMRGPLSARLRWLALGTALAYVSNLVRITALLVTAADVSFGFAVDVLHPVLGLLLFALLVVLMLVLMPVFGLRFEPRPTGTHFAWEAADGGGRPLRFVYAVSVVGALAAGVLVLQAQQFAFLGAGQGAPTIDIASERTILPPVDGWQLSHVEQIGWTDLFGASSRGDLFKYAFPDGPAVVAQVVVADDRATLDRYTIEQCILFHRSAIESVQYVALPYGMTGTIVHDTFDGTPSSVLYWEHPVNVDGRIAHTRIALLLDVEEPKKQVDLAALPGTSTLADLGIRLTTALDGNAPVPTDPRATVDLELVELGSKIVETMVRTGGPARLADQAPSAPTSVPAP